MSVNCSLMKVRESGMSQLGGTVMKINSPWVRSVPIMSTKRSQVSRPSKCAGMSGELI